MGQRPASGRGFTFEFWFDSPHPSTLFIGLGGVWGVGKASRPVRTANIPG